MPPTTAAPATPKAYAIGNQVTFSWPQVTDPDGGISGYQITITGAGAPQVVTLGNVSGYTFTASYGQTVQATVRAISNAGVLGAASAASSGTVVLDPAGDRDGDGVSNASEEIAGTDPLSSGSVFKITGIVRPAAGSVQITWTSVPGIQYEVLATTSIGIAFSAISGPTPIPAAGATTSYTDTTSAGRKFYRIRVVTP